MGDQSRVEPKVIIRGKTFLYKQKAPFVPSGFSVLGALEYDSSEDKVRCHECGEWFKSIPQHAYYAHQISARDYKRKHGLQQIVALVSEGTRIKSIELARNNAQFTAGRAAALEKAQEANRASRAIRRADHFGQLAGLRNERNTCQAQLLFRLKNMITLLGHTPTRTEMEERGLSSGSLCTAFNTGQLSSIMSLVGAVPNISGGFPKYTRELLVECLTRFYVSEKRFPTASDYRRGLLPSWGAFKRVFGSLEKACEAAGLKLAYRAWRHSVRSQASRSPASSEAFAKTKLLRWKTEIDVPEAGE